MKAIRDPLYGFVEVDAVELAVLDTWPVQRLRGINQLSHTFLAYPSACHTRFEHSIGTMHVAGLIAAQLGLNQTQRQTIRLSLLLHDIGHGPFSHHFEEVLAPFNADKVDHEKIGAEILRGSDELQQALGDRADAVTALLQEKEPRLCAEILSGGVDADKLDYLRRDSYHLGVEYGKYDFHRVVRALRRHGEYLVVSHKGADALESFRLARFLMHKQVYTHHVRKIADAMLVRSVILGVDDGQLEKQDFVCSGPHAARFAERLLKWDDSTFVQYLSARLQGRAAKMLSDLQRRVLFKRAFDRPLRDIKPEHRGTLIERDFLTKGIGAMEGDVAKAAKVPAHEVFVIVVTIDKKQYDRTGIGTKSDSPILIENEDGELKDFGELSAFPPPSEAVQRVLVYGPSRARKKLERATIAFLER
jgi:putative nucleotidyltransferase with HDIG domain